MHIKNLTPFAFGTKLCSRKPPQPEMTIAVRGAFTLAPGVPLEVADDQGSLTSEVFAEDDDERAGECFYPNDFAAFKLNAEVLLRGACHAPGGRPVTECPVRFSVGEWSKTLRVTGPRVWSDDLPGAVMSSPLPFTRIHLGYSRAFGGPGYARNPAGKGFRMRELPCVEHPRELVRSRGDTPEPASFGPINPAWPQRAPRLGTEYGSSYRAKRFPYFAEDFDWTYFHAAPADQQLQGYLRGDEELGFVNLHPDAPSFSARLPRLRLRAFVNDIDGRFREVPMSLDTLWADLDRGMLMLTWRGVGAVREDDFADVRTVLLASEPLGERPRPEDHYRRIVQAFEDDPLGRKGRLPPELAGIDEVAARANDEGLQAAEDVTGLDPISALLKRKLGKFRAEDQEKIRKAVGALKQPPPAGGGAAGPPDVDGAVAAVVQKIDDTAPIARSIKPGVLPDIRLRDRVRKVMAVVEQMKKAAAEGKAPIPEGRLEKLEQLPHDPKLRRLDPRYTPPGPISTDEPGPGRDLSEQDLTRRDLHGMDLRGAKLAGTVLTGADLRGADLRGADLTRAILYKADASGANLSGADLTQANLAKLRAAGADLGGARLDLAFFEGADLTGAKLEGAVGEYVVLTKVTLADVKAAGAVLLHADLSESSLDRADFVRARVIACKLVSCRAAKIDLREADVSGSSFEGGHLPGALLTRARGIKSIWLKATLDGADFTLAILHGAHFTEASAVGARFFGADLRASRFYRAALDRAEIVQANLFGADLGKARLGGARLTGSNLYEASFLGASGAGCDFSGANLKRSTLERA